MILWYFCGNSSSSSWLHRGGGGGGLLVQEFCDTPSGIERPTGQGLYLYIYFEMVILLCMEGGKQGGNPLWNFPQWNGARSYFESECRFGYCTIFLSWRVN